MSVTKPEPSDTCAADHLAATNDPNAPNPFANNKKAEDPKGKQSKAAGQYPGWSNGKAPGFWAKCESLSFYRAGLGQNLMNVLHRNISEICPNGFDAPYNAPNPANHCAHFVSHMLGYAWDSTCANQFWATRKNAGRSACIRVDDVFKKTPNRAEIPATGLPSGFTHGLIFACNKQYIDARSKLMTQGDNKHIGIWFNGHVWHYSNSQMQVVMDSLADFMRKFRGAYANRGDVVFWYGDFLQ